MSKAFSLDQTPTLTASALRVLERIADPFYALDALWRIATAIRREPWARSTRLIAITGWGKDQDKQRSKGAGFDEHLTKPVNPDALKPLMARR